MNAADIRCFAVLNGLAPATLAAVLAYAQALQEKENPADGTDQRGKECYAR